MSFVIQDRQEGFGHAVYCAREAIGDEPFLLMLGDHLYRSTDECSCAEQLVKAYQQHATSVLGLRQTPGDQIANFGTVT
ncbi:MAG: GHMP kinase, partial [Anaerolineae bacterium]|nr:GHMP kinase [Anaerolineae bacterium]